MALAERFLADRYTGRTTKLLITIPTRWYPMATLMEGVSAGGRLAGRRVGFGQTDLPL